MTGKFEIKKRLLVIFSMGAMTILPLVQVTAIHIDVGATQEVQQGDNLNLDTELPPINDSLLNSIRVSAEKESVKKNEWINLIEEHDEPRSDYPEPAEEQTDEIELEQEIQAEFEEQPNEVTQSEENEENSEKVQLGEEHEETDEISIRGLPAPPGTTAIHSRTIGSIPWVIDSTGTLTIGSGVFNESLLTGGLGSYSLMNYFNTEDRAHLVTNIIITGPIHLHGSQRGLENIIIGTEPISRGFFEGLRLARTITGIEYINTSNLTDMSRMFKGTGLESLDLSGLDTSNVRNMSLTFSENRYLRELNLSNLDIRNVTHMSSTFQFSTIDHLDLSYLDTSNVTHFDHTFDGLVSITADISYLNTSRAITMSGMFRNSRFTELDISHFDLGRVSDMSFMFNNMRQVTHLNLSGIDTRNVRAMQGMFANSYIKELDVSQFDTSNVTTMQGMFQNMPNIEKLNLSNFDTSRVSNMTSMFSGSTQLKKLDISNFHSRANLLMNSMFLRTSLEQITLGAEFHFSQNAALTELIGTQTHRPYWQNVGTGTNEEPQGAFIFTSAELMAQYNGSMMAGTWVRQPRQVTALTIDIEGEGTVTPTGTNQVERWELTSISATPATGWRFSHWRIDNGDSTVTDVNAEATTVRVREETSLTAVFEISTEFLSVRVPIASTFNTTSNSDHTTIVSSDYEIENLSPFRVDVAVETLTSLSNTNIIQELNIVRNGHTTRLLNQGNLSQTGTISLFHLDTNTTNTFAFSGTANALPTGVSQVDPTFDMVLRFTPNPT
ncbi:BspA family leucine-rich repeat surface protein [Enterococcus mundtii]|uniref:BspA family leucine-rich repeat surface protein n=1 Tax=Enterococcus mundtii TaxID=53346 RepID=UPI0008245783|nr:BspA family leucine-rich repeat surface protein [Enterococcus mundtii]